MPWSEVFCRGVNPYLSKAAYTQQGQNGYTCGQSDMDPLTPVLPFHSAVVLLGTALAISLLQVPGEKGVEEAAEKGDWIWPVHHIRSTLFCRSILSYSLFAHLFVSPLTSLTLFSPSMPCPLHHQVYVDPVTRMTCTST